MPNIPPFLAAQIPKARRLIDLPCHVEIQFSGPTYQVKVVDPRNNEEVWTFLHLDPRGNLRDAFCSCQENQEEGCSHLALSFLCLFDKHDRPLHVRFSQSFWNALGKVWFTRYGDKRPVENDEWKLKGWNALAKDAATKALFHELFAEKKNETEENSIKFSNLSEDELSAWREGHPSAELSYELSYWADLVKKLMVYSESHRYVLRGSLK